MNRKQVKHIANKHYRELKKLIKKVAEDLDAEDIHQFRVVYKKLRAFFRLISRGHKPGKEIKISGNLKKVYHISGAVRDLQLQLQRIIEATDKELKIPRTYLDLLREEISKLKQEFSDVVSQKPVVKSKKRTDETIINGISLTEIGSFIQKKWTAISTIIAAGNFADHKIHLIRKNLKDLFYNLKIHEGAGQDILSRSIWKGKDEPFFYQLLEELGNFQDRCTAIALLNPYRLNRLDQNDREILERIKVRWRKNKQGMKRRLVKKLRIANVPQQTV